MGWTLSGLFIVFMLFDSIIKLPPLPMVLSTMSDMGWPMSADTARGLGMLCLINTLLYAWPRTAPLGAILLTGYLGGAIATQLQAGTPLFSHLLFGVYLGAMLWLGLYLRDPRIAALFKP